VTDHAAAWLERSPYGRALGVELVEISESGAVLRLPYHDRNSNPGKALHGGCAASLGILGGQVVSRASLGPEAGPFHTASIQVNYLAAAIGEEVRASARLLRRGKEMCFTEVDVATLEGRSIAHVTSMVRGRFDAAPSERYAARGDGGEADPGSMGPYIGAMPFTSERGMQVEHMTGAHSRIVMPCSPKNADEGGGVHEGALVALLDTTGAMASWAETGPGPFKASTPSLQAQILSPPVQQDLVGYGWLVQRDREIFWSDVEVAGAEDGKVVARGTVIYRIVT
jgi:uncharacterized protein (TIGR00369 family)